MIDGKFRKAFEVLVVYEDNQDHENFNQVVEEHITVVKASQVDELGIKSDTETKTKTIYPYDMIFVHKVIYILSVSYFKSRRYEIEIHNGSIRFNF